MRAEDIIKRHEPYLALNFVVIAIFLVMSASSIAGEETAASEISFTCTPEPLRVRFEVKGGHYNGEVNCGNLFLQPDIPVAPVVTYGSAKSGKFYTLMMIDPDGDAHGSWPDPVNPGTNSPVRHWIVGNIQGQVLRDGYKESTANPNDVSMLEPYRYPHIPGVSDRYGLFVFEQPGRIEFEKLDDSIINFDYMTFIEKYRLEGPKASNFFVAVYTSVSPFTGKPFHGNDVQDTWHKDYGKGRLLP